MRLVLFVLLILVPTLANTKEKPFAAEGVHRILEVVHLASRLELTSGPGRDVYDGLISQGVPDEDIVDGSVASGRVYCCKSNPHDDFFILFYAPPDVRLKPGDRVEVDFLTAEARIHPRVDYPVVVRRERGVARECLLRQAGWAGLGMRELDHVDAVRVASRVRQACVRSVEAGDPLDVIIDVMVEYELETSFALTRPHTDNTR